MRRGCDMKPVIALCLFATVCLLTVPPGVSDAAQLMTVDEALENVFGDAVEIVPETYELTATELLRIEAVLGKPVFTDEEKIAWGCPIEPDLEVEAVRAARALEEEPSTALQLFFASKDGEEIGAAMIVEAPGKWDMVEFLVGLDTDGTVTRVEILRSQEKRGRDVARRSFLKQFEGKIADDELTVGEDIIAVSGATITSRSACTAVTKATILYRELYLRDDSESLEPAAVAEPESMEAEDADDDGDDADSGDTGDDDADDDDDDADSGATGDDDAAIDGNDDDGAADDDDDGAGGGAAAAGDDDDADDDAAADNGQMP
jgi:hypothetical protein